MTRDVTFALHPIAPFRLDLAAWALRRRPGNAIDRWHDGTYERTIVVGQRAYDLAAVAAGPPARPELRVVVRGAPAAARAVARATLERALGLRVDLHAFYRRARADRRIAPLVDRFRGVKPPRFPTVFEAVVNGIACQQLTLTVGIALLGRLARACGLASASGARAFPRPRDVAALDVGALRGLGFSHAKARALIELARACEAGLDLERLADLDDAAAIDRLLALRGVGRWTAEYVLLRGLGRIAVFPGDDVGARANLARWLHLRAPLDYDRVRALARRWAPHAGLLYFHLLLQSLDEAGLLGDQPTSARSAASSSRASAASTSSASLSRPSVATARTRSPA